MFLAALVDAGVPLDTLQDSVDALDVEPVKLSSRTVTRHGLRATKVDVACEPGAHHRNLPTIRALIEGAGLAEPVTRDAVDAFTRLADAEAAAHGVDVADVHFHEVGALDALTDIVATCAGVDWLRRERGLRTISASTVTVGGGTTTGAHGGIPLPAPAALFVLSGVGAPVSGEVDYEACTPTGAALIATHAVEFGGLPPMRLATVGVGAGGHDPRQRANVLRLLLGVPDVAAATRTATAIECNVDDMDPRLWPATLTELLAAGASDAWLTPILMKKGRPGHTLHVLCPEGSTSAVTDVIFRNTTTIGLRRASVVKEELERRFSTIYVDGRPVGVKIASDDHGVRHVSVEYEDVADAAARLGRPVKSVLARAEAAARELFELT